MPRLRGAKKPGGQPRYTWAIVRSECSVSCGGGRSLLMPPLVVGPEGPGCIWGHGHAALTGPHRIWAGSSGLLPEASSQSPEGEQRAVALNVPQRPHLPSPIPYVSAWL